MTSDIRPGDRAFTAGTDPGMLRDVGRESDAVKPLVTGAAAGPFVEGLQYGDRAVLEVLYRQHHEAVRAFARRLVGDFDVAEDLVHDVFLSVPAAFRRYRGDCAMRTFLIAITVQRSKHYVRSASRRRHALERLSNEPMHRTTTPDEPYQRRELAQKLQRALDRLPLAERVVVVLCEVEERTSSDTAAIVGCPEVTVRTRLFRAKRRLREILGEAP
jgi:RNA polymerase sigma-70 factor (ECF subfamily)